MEFETISALLFAYLRSCVNLLRWSLKQTHGRNRDKLFACKFTPMEFETVDYDEQKLVKVESVNLLRWSLKL